MSGNDAARAVACLVSAWDELELADRPPGELVTITRQAQESILNDLAVAGRLIRKMAEGAHG